MTQAAKATSAGSTEAGGSARGPIRRALATRDARGGSKGIGAPSSRRAPTALAVFALAIAAFVLTAAPASAAPPATVMGTVSNVSYDSAEVTGGKLTTDGSGEFGGTAYKVQYSTDGVNWTSGPGGFEFGAVTDKALPPAEITGLKGGTKYFVRLAASNGFSVGATPEAVSPGPNPSFTTLTVDPPSVIATDNASAVEYTTATVKGKVNRPANPDPAFNVDCHFQYVTEEEFQTSGFADNPGDVPCEGTNPIENPGNNDVEAHLTGLANNTAYHLRLIVSNGSPTTDAKEAPSTFKTLAVDPPVVVATDNASKVFSTSATATGEIQRSATPDSAFDITSCRFEYVTATQFGTSGFDGAASADCVESINNAPGDKTTVSATLTGLEPGTTYHLRLAAGNAAASPGTKEAAATYTTTAKVAKPNVLATGIATAVDQDSAKVSGEVQRPAGEDPALNVTCRFEYVTEASFQGNEEQSLRIRAGGGTYTVGFKGASTTLAFNASAATVKAALESLSTIGAGDVTVRGGPGSRTGSAPYLIVFVGALAGKDVEALTASPGGLIEPIGGGGYSAELVTTAEGGHAPGFVNPGRTDCELPVSDEGPQEVKAAIPYLESETTYRLRLTAENGGGTDSKEAAAPFTTTANLPPSAVLGPITEVSYGGAKLTGEYDSDNLFSSVLFEVSTDEVDWIEAGGVHLIGGPKLQPVGPIVVTGLEGATKYFVRLRVVAANVGGIPDPAVSPPPYSSFTTLPVDPPTILKANDATDVDAETAKVSGEIERPANPDPAFDANCHFEYVTDAQFLANGYQNALQVPCGIDSLSSPEEKRAVEAELTDLKSGTKYHVRLTATNAGPDVSLEANTFMTTAVPATVTATAGASDGEGGYFLAGLVNPRNATVNDCKFVYGPNSAATPAGYAFAEPCSPLPGPINKLVTVEGHVTGLTPGATYHSRLVVTNAFGTAITPDQTFTPTLKAKETCANEQQRKENSSFALPECRAYEQVSDPSKEGYGATYFDEYGDDTAQYRSRANNIANSGVGALSTSWYTTHRTDAGWKTIANLNGPSGSPYNDVEFREGYPYGMYSADLQSSIWRFVKPGEGLDYQRPYLRQSDGKFALIGETLGRIINRMFVSDDLSRIVVDGNSGAGNTFGHGVYEYVGTGTDLAERIDVDNSGTPIVDGGNCGFYVSQGEFVNAQAKALSGDGRVVVFAVAGACSGDSTPADGLWARVDQKVSYELTKSQCTRGGADPCNGPSNAGIAGVARDGSRVFFTTTQQLLNGDTDGTSDLYACDIPLGSQTPTGDANSCSALRQVSGATTGADVQRVLRVSEDGSTVVFIARGVLGDNEDAFGLKASLGDENLYAWRTDADHPDGQSTFIGRLASEEQSQQAIPAETTPDGRSLILQTINPLVPADTDETPDVYRYDVEAGELARISFNIFGTGGNGDFEAIPRGASDDGQKVVFETAEPLSPLDGNGEGDVYLWSAGRVSLIGTGSAQGGTSGAAISGSGKNIYFATRQVLSPSDIDGSADVYTARIGGGFVFTPKPTCTGETCQPKVSDPPAVSTPALPNPEGNIKPKKTCPKGKILKGNKCIKKPKKPRKNKGKGKGKRASDKRGGGK